MPAGLKAGLVGAAVAVLLSLLLPAPRVVWIAIAPSVVLYVAVEILAAYWAEFPRDVGKGASAGAVAGLVTGLAHGLLYGLSPMIINVVRFIERDLWAALPRQFHQLLRGIRAAWRVGDDPGMASIGAAALWCGSGIMVAVSLGAAGGAVFSSLQSESPTAPEETPPPARNRTSRMAPWTGGSNERTRRQSCLLLSPSTGAFLDPAGAIPGVSWFDRAHG